MRSSSKSLGIAVAFPLVAAVFTVACDRHVAPPAAVEEGVSTTTLTSAEITPKNDDRDGYRAAVRREQRDLDGQIQLALEAIDRKLGTHPNERAQLLRTRNRLAADQRLVAKSDERGWDELRAEVERDLNVTDD